MFFYSEFKYLLSAGLHGDMLIAQDNTGMVLSCKCGLHAAFLAGPVNKCEQE